jgi:hypothetical protein
MLAQRRYPETIPAMQYARATTEELAQMLDDR